MASHFSSIGMPIRTNKDMMKLLDKASKTGEKIVCRYGYYSKWLSETGAELWIQFNKSDEIVGVNPFYHGESCFSVGIINKIDNEEYNDFESLFYAWVNPQDNDPEMGDYPLAFDCVNISSVENIDLPCIINIKLCAFAYKLEIYPNEENYNQYQKNKYGEHHYASKSFIPSGTFPPNDNESFDIIPEAIFTGIIVDHKKYKNELTGKKYFWIKVETYGGIIDVVVDPDLINNKLEKNGIISGVFYMCGKIIY
ncbi:hypothetical protein FACS1894172_13280 [Spirochaetia bacterium]|nr:hypothetical protein FACS1894164_16780 [Spirochaetia bacterium]GHU33869.1 hypothetical protein FACS1894172_13280 [Spirochaetia bacterium]